MPAGITLGELSNAAGQSLGEAQQALAGHLPSAPTTMAIADTTLEIKVALSADSGSELKVHTISPDDIRRGAIDPTLLSTVTMRFAAVPSAAAAASPVRLSAEADRAGVRPIDREEAIRRIAEAVDVKRLANILGPLRFTAEAVAGGQAFTVSARDGEGRLVRTATISALEQE